MVPFCQLILHIENITKYSGLLSHFVKSVFIKFSNKKQVQFNYFFE